MSRPTPPTQKQIAARLGVSQTLVSRALSGRAGEIGASPATIEKIRRAAAECNYHPSAAALALLGVPTRTIGVVVKKFDDPYFGHLIGALQALARKNSHSLMLTGGGAEDLAALHKHRVDGVILAGSDFRPPGLRAFVREGVPVVQIGTGTRFPGACQIHMDEEVGIGEMVSYLAGLGHREIGFVAKAADTNRRRGSYLRRALRAHGLPVRDRYFFISEGQDAGAPSEAADRAVDRLRRDAKRPTALIAAEDSIAIALLRKLYEAGLRVPQDLSVTGIDDIPASAQTIPPLTTLRQPLQQMAAAAICALMGEGAGCQPVRIVGEMVFRGSCAPYSRNS
jgi:LacI family transcriptional regulator